MIKAGDLVSRSHRIWQAAPLLLALTGCSREVLVGSLPDGATASACDPGAPPGVSIIASGLDLASAVPTTLQGETLFFATQAGIMKVPLGGGVPTMLTTDPSPYPGQPAPSDIHVDATNVYVSSPSWMVSMPLGGGQTTTLHHVYHRSLSGQLAVDAESLYWVESWIADSTSPAPQSWLMSMPLGGGEATVLASLGEPGSDGQGIAVDDENVYWTQVLDGRVLAMPKAGGDAITIASDQSNPNAIVLDAESVYWMNDVGVIHHPPETNAVLHPDHVLKAPKAGGAPTSFGAGMTVPNNTGGVVVNAAGVYWIEDTWPAEGGVFPIGSRVMRAPHSGGPAEVVAVLSTDTLSRPVPCPGGICWAALDRTEPPSTGGRLMRYNACP